MRIKLQNLYLCQMNTDMQSKNNNQNQSFQDPCKFLILDNASKQKQKQTSTKTLQKRRGRPPKNIQKKQEPPSSKLKKNIKANKVNKKLPSIYNIQELHEKLDELQLQNLKTIANQNVKQTNIYKQIKLGKIIEIINLEHMKMIIVDNGRFVKVPIKLYGIEIEQASFQQFASILDQVKNFLQLTIINKIVKVSFDQYDKTGKASVRIMARTDTDTQTICLNNWLLQNILSKLKFLNLVDYKEQLLNIAPSIINYE